MIAWITFVSVTRSFTEATIRSRSFSILACGSDSPVKPLYCSASGNTFRVMNTKMPANGCSTRPRASSSLSVRRISALSISMFLSTSSSRIALNGFGDMRTVSTACISLSLVHSP